MTVEQLRIARQLASDVLAGRKPKPRHARTVLGMLDAIERPPRRFAPACHSGCRTEQLYALPDSHSFWFAPGRSGRVRYNLHWCLDCGCVRGLATDAREDSR